MFNAIINSVLVIMWAYLYLREGSLEYAFLLCIYGCLAGISIHKVIDDRNKILP
jgi:hypothetical protein